MEKRVGYFARCDFFIGNRFRASLMKEITEANDDNVVRKARELVKAMNDEMVEVELRYSLAEIIKEEIKTVISVIPINQIPLRD